MKQEDSIFGAEPDDLKRLVRFSLEEDDPDTDEDITPPTASVDELMEHPGVRIGRYKLLRILGEGGMGIVYLAEQDEPVKRQVALKVIKPGMDSKRVMARFEAEEQALALMEHSHVARVYDADLTGSGRPYFVMEYVKGIPITKHCDKYKLTVEERLHLFLQVCEAVQHAHQKGIIHRDIKPSNILVSIEGTKAIPKVIDFGVARAVSQQLTEKTLYTEQGQLIGTPEYMSPEQADINNEDIDTRTDIYALGVMLYELLAGVLPFDPSMFQTGGIEHMRKIICEEEPKTPSTKLSKTSVEELEESARLRRTNAGALQRRLQGDLDWITLKAIEKDRTRRYDSAGELAADIRRHLSHEPVLASPPSTFYRLNKFVRRHKGLVAGTLGMLAVSLIGTVVSTIFAIGQARARAEAQAVSDFLRKDVLWSIDLWRTGGQEVNARSVLDTVSEKVGEKFANKPLIEASIRRELGATYTFLGLYKAAEQQFRRTLEIHRSQLGADHQDTFISMWDVGWVYWWQSRYHEAEPLLTKALKGMEIMLDEDDEDRLYCMAILAWLYGIQGRFNEAEQLFGEGLSTLHRVLGEKNVYSPTFMHGLARVYYMQGHYDKAELLYNEALDLSCDVRGEKDMETLSLMNSLGELYWELGHYDKAEQLLVKALDSKRNVLGEHHLMTFMTMNSLARLYHSQGRYEQAESLFVKTMETSQAVLGAEHDCSTLSMCGLGAVYLSQGQYDQAESLLTNAWGILYSILSEDNWASLSVKNTLGKLYTAQGYCAKAEELYLETMEARKHRLGEDHPDTLESKNDLAVLYKVQSRYDEAEELLLEAFKGRQLKLGDKHPHTLQSLKNLIELYESWGKPDEAAKWREELRIVD